LCRAVVSQGRGRRGLGGLVRALERRERVVISPERVERAAQREPDLGGVGGGLDAVIELPR
jgi:hypothetical protein